MLPKKFSLILIFSIILTLGLSISLGSLLAAWTSPTATPPGSNIASPINTSTTGQSKQGGLILNTGGSANGLIVQSGNVGIGTTDPQAKLEVNGNIIASDPTANNHLATKSYVDASEGGGCFDQYHYPWCTTNQGQKCARVGTMDYKCVGDFCTKAGISNDMDGDGVTGATDCNDNDPTIVAATDGTCDGDADGKIDYTAYTATPKPALADCADSNASSYICTANGTACTVGTTCSSGFCIDGYCCNNTCSSTCQACNVAGSLGTCTNVPDDADINNDCSLLSPTDYIYGGTNPTCYRYLSPTAHDGMCNGSGSCYAVADSFFGQGASTLSCGSTGCWKACVANQPATSYNDYSEVCYTDNATHSCIGNLVCDAIGDCKLSPGVACTADNQCGNGYWCGVDGDSDGYLSSVTTGTCLAKQHGDCCDTDVRVHPGQSNTYETINGCGNFDYNCSGTADKETYTCRYATGCYLSGSCDLCSGSYSTATISYGELSCGQIYTPSYYNQARITQNYPSCGTQNTSDWYTAWGWAFNSCSNSNQGLIGCTLVANSTNSQLQCRCN